MASARQTALNAITVVFEAAPRSVYPTGANDVLNPALWSLIAVEPADAVVRLAQAVEERDELTYVVLFDGVLGAPATYTLVLTGAADPLGIPIVDCSALDIETFPPAYREPGPPTRDDRRDLRNPQVIKDGNVVGTFQLTASGDLDSEGGDAYARKRILRRFTTGLGSFFHLPEYGLRPGIKTLERAGDLRRMRANVIAQVRQEPDVVEVSCSVEQVLPGLVRVSVRAKLDTGQTIDVARDVNTGATSA